MGLFGGRPKVKGPTLGELLSPEPATSVRARTDQRPPTPESVARDLFREFPDGIDVDTLWDRCEAAGVEMSRVDRALDELRYAAEVKVETVKADALRVLDLTALPFVRTRIKGSAYWVTDAQRRRFGGPEYLLMREPQNRADPNAVAVYGHGRKVGYVSTAKAAGLAPLLDRLAADAYRVGGAGAEQGMRLWVDLPTLDGLRRFVKARS